MSARAQAAVFDWQDGERRLAAVPPAARQACERVVAAVHGELRRRLGGAFTVADLADEYGPAGDWFLPLALDVAPRVSQAHDAAVTLDTAFARFMRRAQDAGLW